MVEKYKPPFGLDDTIYEITVTDVIEAAEQLGIDRAKITDEVIVSIQKALDTFDWASIVEDVLYELGIHTHTLGG